MIQLYTGTPGSGKSLHAVHEIRSDLFFGKYVISTMFVDVDMVFYTRFQRFLFKHFGFRPKQKNLKNDPRKQNFRYIDILKITPDYLYNFAAKYHEAGKEHQTTVYLDECVAIFSPTVIGDNVKAWNDWDKFFRVHRHLGFDVVLIPQSQRLISRKVIEYCEYEVRHYNRKYHGSFGMFLSLFVGGLFSYSVCWRGVRSKPLSQGWLTYNRYYGSLYNSYCLFDDTLLPYQQKQKQALLKKLCFELNQIKNIKQGSDKLCQQQLL